MKREEVNNLFAFTNRYPQHKSYVLYNGVSNRTEFIITDLLTFSCAVFKEGDGFILQMYGDDLGDDLDIFYPQEYGQYFSNVKELIIFLSRLLDK